MEHNCIVTFDEKGLQVVGPFDTLDALSAWGAKWQAENGDDPRWHSLSMPDPDAVPVRIVP